MSLSTQKVKYKQHENQLELAESNADTQRLSLPPSHTINTFCHRIISLVSAAQGRREVACIESTVVIRSSDHMISRSSCIN